MTHSGTWTPYAGSSSIALAVGLLIVTGVLLYSAFRLPHPMAARKRGWVLGLSLVVIWFLSVTTFVIAILIYEPGLSKQVTHATSTDPIAPVTGISVLVAFVVIVVLTARNGFWVAVGSAVVGTIAAPMIFELPFDLIVVWRAPASAPERLLTFLLFLIEVSTFTMLTLSPVIRLSRATLFLLAGMFLLFAVWALFGFAYPATPIPIALNSISKVLAFATAVSLFLPPERGAWFARPAVAAAQEIGQ